MHFKKVKTILSPKNGVNLYRGCTHGCIYCDSRSTCYQLEHDFEDIEVKENAIELLELALKRKKKRCMISFGSMSDPYMPIEASLMYTRKMLEVIDKYGFGIHIITKSDLILRDLDLLERINQKSRVVVSMTLTTYDEEVCKIVEPNVATTKRRFEVLMQLKARGIETVVWICPILPYINDTYGNIRGILSYCIEADVKAILSFNSGMTLREGNREYYYKKLDEFYPGLKKQYQTEFKNHYGIGNFRTRQVENEIEKACKKYGILHNVEEVFAYIHKFERKNQEVQLSLFD